MRAKWLVWVVASGLGTIAWAQGASQGEGARERMFDVVRGECKSGRCNLSDAEMDAMRGDLNRYVDRGGRDGEMRSTVRASLDAGCRGVCLAESVRNMADLMERGRTDRQSKDAVVKALRDDKRERDQKKLQLSDAQCRERLHARLDRHAGTDRDRGERARDDMREMRHGEAGREGTMPHGR